MAELILAVGSAPATPTSGRVTLYSKNDKLLYYKDDGGAEHSTGYMTSELIVSGFLTPTILSANQNDYAPAGIATASTLRLSSNASRDITGMDSVQAGKTMLLHNIGAQNIVLKDESASSVAANRFALTADITLSPDDCAILQYDSTSSRWRALAKPPPAGSGITTLNSQVGATQSFADVDDTNVTLTIASAANTHTFTIGWTGTLALSRFVNASAISVLLGRGSAAGAGVFQEITLGSGLTMTGTVLSSSGGGSGLTQDQSLNLVAFRA